MTPTAYTSYVLDHEYSKCGPWSKIWTAKGFPVDRRGPPVSANKAEKQGLWTPELSGNISMWTPEQKVWVPLY